MSKIQKTDSDISQTLEQVVIQGDLSKLQPHERVDYYRQVCESLGLNPYTKPFEYIRLQGKLSLYPKKDATDQLRSIHGVSIDDMDLTFNGDLLTVTCKGSTPDGRHDVDVGVIDMSRERDKPIGIMKAVTKAKRRLTLSLVGLGWTTEVEMLDVQGAEVADVDDEGKLIEAYVDEAQDHEAASAEAEAEAKAQDEQLEALWATLYETLDGADDVLTTEHCKAAIDKGEARGADVPAMRMYVRDVKRRIEQLREETDGVAA